MGLFSAIRRLFRRDKHGVYYTYENDLPEEDIADNRQRILDLLRGTNRKGVDKLIEYMERNDFFNVPSSIHHHHNYRGGLAQHVLSVFDLASVAAPDLPADSLAIVSIGHDLCKTDKWHYDKKGGLHRNHGKDQHRGRKSIKILADCGFELTESERMAIRWHMGGHNANFEEQDDAQKARKDPLWRALYDANKKDSTE